jgi:hypothetical protein
MVAQVNNPSYAESIHRRMEVQAGPGKGARPFLKITKVKKSWRYSSSDRALP